MSGPAEELREKYKKILIANGIHDKVANVILKDSGAKGDGIASLTQCVTITFENETKAPLNFFVKMRTDSASHNAMLDDWKAFEKEAVFFMEFLPAAKQFCESKGMKNITDFYPKVYYGDENLIVLEHLVIQRGYDLLPSDYRHDLKIATLVLETLAKHHALTHAMIQESGGAEKFFQRYQHLDLNVLAQPTLVQLGEGFSESGITNDIIVLEANPSDVGNETIAKLEKLKGTSAVMFLNAVKRDNRDKLLMLSHGDYKKNNMMFLKDKDTNDILHLIAIDYQCLSYNPPTLDLLFYLFSSVEPSLRQSQLETLLNIYRNALNTVSKKLGYSIDLAYEDLLLEYRRKMDYAYLVGLSLVGPGLGLIKASGVDISEIDMADFGKVFGQCLKKYITENPEEGRNMAEEIINLVKEYEKLKL